MVTSRIFALRWFILMIRTYKLVAFASSFAARDGKSIRCRPNSFPPDLFGAATDGSAVICRGDDVFRSPRRCGACVK